MRLTKVLRDQANGLSLNDSWLLVEYRKPKLGCVGD